MDPDWGAETLAWWNKYVNSLIFLIPTLSIYRRIFAENTESNTAEYCGEEEPTTTALIEAQMAATVA